MSSSVKKYLQGSRNDLLKNLHVIRESTDYFVPPSLPNSNPPDAPLPPPHLHMQTFRMWKAIIDLNRFPGKVAQNKLVTLHVDDGLFPFVEREDIDCLLIWLSAYFPSLQFHVRPMQSPLKLCSPSAQRLHPDGDCIQVDAASLYTTLRQDSSSLFSMVLTSVELFVKDVAKFVLGFSHFDVGAGAVCLGKTRDLHNESREMLFQRLLKSTTHELCHLMGLEHCSLFHCLMNEHSSLQQVAQSPMLLCPVCLTKAQYILPFNVDTWYRVLHDVSKAFPLHLQPQFTAGEVAFLDGFKTDNQ